MNEHWLRAEQIGKKDGFKDAEQLLRKAANPKSRINVTPDSQHHVGDEVGKLMNDAYDEGGAPAAVDVLLAYLDAYNAQRRINGLPLIAPETVRDTLGLATSGRAERPQIDEMRDEFTTRTGIAPRTSGQPDA